MSYPSTARVFILNEAPVGPLNDKTFRIEERPLPKESDLKENQIVIKVEALSNDPAQRNWLAPNQNPKRGYAPPILEGDPVRARVIGKVVASKVSRFAVGDRVAAQAAWAEYAVIDDHPFWVNKAADVPGQSPYISLGYLGTTGLTAWAGAFKEMKLEPEHTLIVSGAAGAVGSVLIQIAKHVIGVKKVIGIAGGKEKTEWIKSLGADEAIDYKDPEYLKHLTAAVPEEGADRYFDNVGGEILDNILKLVKPFGFVSVCGAISGYNNETPGLVLKNWGEVIVNRLTLKGFIVIDHMKELPEGVKELAQWLTDGKVKNTEGETVVDTKFEDIPQTYKLLFEGANRGKLITKLV